MTTRIGINGFGRIGRSVFRIAASNPDIEVVGINDLADPHSLAYLLEYDSVHRRFGKSVTSEDDAIIVDGSRVPFTQIRNPAEVPWGDWGADIVIEATGALVQREQAAGHLQGGAKRVLISAPGKGVDGTFVMGVNHGDYDPAKHKVFSNASCTTNCLAPVAKVLEDSFGVETLLITTVHAYTISQAILDRPDKKDPRRGRAAAVSIIPASTGAAKATAEVIPSLAGKMDGMALRVPVPDGSVTDIVANLARDVTVDDVHAALRAAASGPMKGFLDVSDAPLVSADIIGNAHSSIVDAQSTMAMGARTVKVLSWYDNEWGYANRCVDLALHVAAKGV
ncbi:type I glyceraldehyde-3-phosphate dehydrogenase [Pseudenhygromyxa sp. WMMC2535]|uniref:type I glyceraldehyde-3-phosphate dehydrogenase n=1 Tax=Pseudenhygromyxa sp. WMMC2535 TaxID=2712867 RepID=UPI001553ADCE|nr:type I glyceraldehyde-3-phosphate dehydrogenase [Pseudenhygromyxa sp. WMMC2535]NVB37742.1 type I glyceraldehyde-3-phosphate dehydrogenase [Pseudenhygromyxa sp. WMMC2535]